MTPGPPIENLVFSGGGARAVAYIGALEVLHRHGILAGVRRYAGTSAGSITALLLAAGFSPREMRQIFLGFDLTRLLDPVRPRGFLDRVLGLTRQFGWYPGTAFLGWLRLVLAEKMPPDCTLAEFVHRTGRELHVVATDLNAHGAARTFSAASTPEVRVIDAVRASISIPIFFKPLARDTALYLDGGLSVNYPIDVFDRGEYTGGNPGVRVCNPHTLGLRLVPPRRCLPHPPRAIFGWRQFLASLVSTMLDACAERLTDHRTVLISTLSVGMTDFSVPYYRKRALIRSGARAMESYLARGGSSELIPQPHQHLLMEPVADRRSPARGEQWLC